MNLLERLQKETNELEQFVANVNKDIAFRQGKIALLKEMVEAEQKQEEADEPTN